MKTDEMNEEITDLSGLVDVDNDEAEAQVYEVGYHLLPIIGDDAVPGEAAKITEAVTKIGGEIVGERMPALVNFAYALGKKIDGKNQEFASGYFGWTAFSAAPSALEALTEVLDANTNVLRYIITKTSAEQVAATLADPSLDVGALEPETEVEEVVGADTEGEESAPESEEEEAA